LDVVRPPPALSKFIVLGPMFWATSVSPVTAIREPLP
jgi:hypothetical protein